MAAFSREEVLAYHKGGKVGAISLAEDIVDFPRGKPCFFVDEEYSV